MSTHESSATTASLEPIAIIGIGCRFPAGADDPAKFWELLTAGLDGIIDVPEDRWDIRRFYSADPNKPGKMYVRKAGFLRGPINQFDPLFFGISPREAVYMDPQQRLLLEVTWEALEDAGVPPPGLAGSDTGVYIGAFTLDNMVLRLSPLNRDRQPSHHGATAATMTMLANRLSYTFDLRGPSVAVDTACSASLVALHFACQALWRGECSLALAGGVNVILSPDFVVMMCQGRFLAPDGYCKSFDERADGYGRGEGCGIVVLKPLAAAVKDGDEIYAVVRGTGINQDGRTDGIAVPNPLAQEALIRQVYSQAKIGLDQIQYVEAHGTGTAVGDPIEASVLGKTIGANRSADNACVIGSVKANIGHLEAAAGVAGVVKACLCLKHRQIPPQANVRKPNPKIPFAEWGLRLPSALEPMPKGNGPRFVGVNSFGYGGTNAHAVLQEAPELRRAEQADLRHAHVLPISARHEGALKALAQRYLTLLAGSDAPHLSDLCYSAAVRRAHLDHRLAITAETSADVVEQIQAYLDGGRSERVSTGRWVPGTEPKPVFVFSGMGPQWWAMGQQLLREEPVFRETAAKCDELFTSVAGWSILAEMSADESRSRMREPQIAQPANFVLQAALSALWQSWGIEPAAIVGHSVGEVAAAYVSGALELADAIRVIYHRSRLQQTTAGAGGMLAVSLPAEAVRVWLAGRETRISIAALNGPRSVTLAGDPEALRGLAAELNEQNVFNRVLQVDVAYHSHQMEKLESALTESLHGLRPRRPTVPLFSTVTGRLVQEECHDGGYWYRNIRWPVLFAEAVGHLIENGHLLFIEVGAHPVLSAAINECVMQRGIAGRVLSSLRRDEPESLSLRKLLGSLYTCGTSVDWRRVCPEPARYVRLPTYPWQRERYWQEEQAAEADRLGNVAHPLLGSPVRVAGATWESDLNPNYVPYLSDHIIEGVPVLPAAAYVEAGLAVHRLTCQSEPAVLEDLEFHRALLLDTSKDVCLQWSYDEKSGEYRACTRVSSDGSPWTVHATGRISTAVPAATEPVDLPALRARCGEHMETNGLYARLRQHGLQYGPSFQSIRDLWRSSREVIARLELDPRDSTELDDYHLHPALLDASFQSLIATLEATEESAAPRAVFLPVRIGEVRYFSKPGRSCWCYGSLTKRSESAIEGDILLCDDHGNVLVALRGLRCSALAASKPDETRQLQPWMYRLGWEEAPPVAPVTGQAPWLVFSDDGAVGVSLAEHLCAHGASAVIQVVKGCTFERKSAALFQIRPRHRGDMDDVIRQIDIANCRGVVYLWGLDRGGDEVDPVGIAGVVDGLHLVQALANAVGPRSPRLYFVTRGAQQVEPGEPITGLAQAALIGLGRVIASEYPDLRCALVDIDQLPGTEGGRHLALEILSDSEEDDIALRGSERYVRRLVRVSVKQLEEETARRRLLPATGRACRLEVGRPGSMETLRFRELQQRSPGPREVEVKIRAAALNFKDVLKALGMLPEKALEHTFHGSHLGMEAAGVITQVGRDVHEYRVGDAIIASLPGCFSSHLTVPVDSLFAVPQSDLLSPADAATIPVVFMTAYYALHELARLSAGEKVLIHAAAGGVGLAAIQVARWVGAEIFATAGSPEKRDFLRRLGVEHIWDSRTLEFADRIRAVTGGRGVDVVLNSVSGESVLKSLSIMAPFGRFIEIGKRDIVENNRLPMLPFNRNLTFAAIDLDQMMVDRPDLVRKMLRAVWERVGAGDFSPLPVRIFPAAEVAEAFRYMAQAKQIGKIVIDMENTEGVSLLPSREKEQPIRTDATYLVTGGFGGFGLEVGRWLASAGARHLVLVGRNGPVAPRARQVVEELTRQGVSVMSVAADVSQESQIAELLARIRETMPPLRGIVHAAAVLDDGLLTNLDEARFARVMAPKALGAWILHQQTRSIPLDFFVLFSSATAWMGNPGQGNYVAANAFLDSLAQHRRAEGLAATSISWGALADVGMLAQNEQAAEYLSRVGIRALPVASAMAALSHVLTWDPTMLAIMDVDWARWRQLQPMATRCPRFSQVLGESEGAGENLATTDLRTTLMTLALGERLERLASAMAEVVGETLRMPAGKVDVRQPLSEMGIDSLVGVELQLTISTKLGIEVSLLELMKADNIVNLARRLLEKMNISGISATLEQTTGVSVPGGLVSQQAV